MKKNIRIAAILLVVALIFCACGDSTKEFTCQELTMTVPSSMSDVSGQSAFSAFTFALDSNKIAIFGLREDFSLFGGAGAYTLEEYADLVILANGLSSNVSTRAGKDYLYFSYEATTGSGQYKYLAGLYEADGAFWMVQVAGPIDNYNETEFLTILDSVSFG